MIGSTMSFSQYGLHHSVIRHRSNAHPNFSNSHTIDTEILFTHTRAHTPSTHLHFDWEIMLISIRHSTIQNKDENHRQNDSTWLRFANHLNQCSVLNAAHMIINRQTFCESNITKDINWIISSCRTSYIYKRQTRRRRRTQRN